MLYLGGPLDQPGWLGQQHRLQIIHAKEFKSRLFGLHAWQYWGDTPRGLLFNNCYAIHTMGLRNSIDIICFNKNIQIIDIKINLKINKFYIKLGSKYMLELPANYCVGNFWQKQVISAMYQAVNLI